MKIKLFVFIEVMMIMSFVYAQKDTVNFNRKANLQYFPYATIEPYNIQGDTLSALILYDSTISQNIKGVVEVYFKFGNMADTIIHDKCINGEIYRNIENIQIDTIKISTIILLENCRHIILSDSDNSKKELFNYYRNKLYPFIKKNIKFSQMKGVYNEDVNFIIYMIKFAIIGKNDN